jgi:hypothetical protein
MKLLSLPFPSLFEPFLLLLAQIFPNLLVVVNLML